MRLSRRYSAIVVRTSLTSTDEQQIIQGRWKLVWCETEGHLDRFSHLVR
jgi:hypothetical protein